MRNLCQRCGVEILGDGTEWADWTKFCEECDYDEDDENDQ